MTNREAKRIALKNIIDVVSSDLVNDADYWAQHPEKNSNLSEEHAAKVASATKQILHVLERRASRLRSFDGAR